MPSNFEFLGGEWPEVYDAAARGEVLVHADPRSSCFDARRALELSVAWNYKHDPALELPYQDNLSATSSLESPSVSRALEIGTHGLNGGPAETHTAYDVGESRVYQ
jgi:hypothetical protein